MNDLVKIDSSDPSPLRELVVISGKGGTGKTSIVASFAALAGKAALADCDVDASDLPLLLDPRILHREPFTGGSRARIRPDSCSACGNCQEVCRFDAIHLDGPGNGVMEKTFQVAALACEGCGVCAWFCPEGAVDLRPVVNGEWLISETRFGPLVHARLGIAAENSGKLVATVRTHARQVAAERGRDLLLIDGSPGVGCPVIASLTGSSQALLVTEPTLSGLHDLERVAELTRHFAIPALVCVNKWDLNPEISERIEARARGMGLDIAGRVRYDRAVTEAQTHGQTVVEFQSGGCSRDIRAVWERVKAGLTEASPAALAAATPRKP